MPRDFYETVLGGPNASGLFEVFSGVSVSLRARGTTNVVTMFQRETGVSQGPSPEAGAVGGPNPFTTGASGSVQFWADIGRLDIFLHDTQVPARLADRTIQWNAKPFDDIPGANILGNIPGRTIAWASGIPESDLVLLLDKWLPIGIQIPFSGGTLPTGGVWDWADGGLINRITYATFFSRVGHSYNGGVDPGSSQVRKPDKRGRVPVGADNFGLTGAANRIPNSNRARGQNGGEERHAQSIAEMAAHNHGSVTGLSVAPGAHGHDPAATIDGGSSYNVSGAVEAGDSNHNHSIPSQGSGTAFNVLQPYEVDNYLVRIA